MFATFVPYTLLKIFKIKYNIVKVNVKGVGNSIVNSSSSSNSSGKGERVDWKDKSLIKELYIKQK